MMETHWMTHTECVVHCDQADSLSTSRYLWAHCNVSCRPLAANDRNFFEAETGTSLKLRAR